MRKKLSRKRKELKTSLRNSTSSFSASVLSEIFLKIPYLLLTFLPFLFDLNKLKADPIL